MASGSHEIEDEWDNTAWEEEEDEVIAPNTLPKVAAPSGLLTAASTNAEQGIQLEEIRSALTGPIVGKTTGASASSTAKPQGRSQTQGAPSKPPKLPNKFFFAILVMVITGYMILRDAFGVLEAGNDVGQLYLSMSEKLKKPKKPGKDASGEVVNNQQFGVVSVKSAFEHGSIDELGKKDEDGAFLSRGEDLHQENLDRKNEVPKEEGNKFPEKNSLDSPSGESLSDIFGKKLSHDGMLEAQQPKEMLMLEDRKEGEKKKESSDNAESSREGAGVKAKNKDSLSIDVPQRLEHELAQLLGDQVAQLAGDDVAQIVKKDAEELLDVAEKKLEESMGANDAKTVEKEFLDIVDGKGMKKGA